MKVFKAFLFILLGLLLGIGGAVGFYLLTMGEIAWQEYLETKLIPNAVIVISAIGSLCVAAIPIISKVRAALDKFDKATNDINETVQTGRRTDDALYEQDAKIAELKAEMEHIRFTADETKEMLRIGLCNTKELVVNGYAAEIAKVVHQHEE